MDRKNWSAKLGDAIDLQDAAVPGLPVIEIVGNIRVLMEHHCGVTEYGNKRIVVKMKKNMVAVDGDCLELTKMTSDQLIITGTIYGVSLFGR